MLVYPWQAYEIRLTATQGFINPDRDVHVEVVFTHESGLTLRRPDFWDGERTWKVRFAFPGLSGDWISSSSPKWQVSLGRCGLLSPGVVYVGYLENGGPMLMIDSDQVPLPYRVYDPRTVEVIGEGVRENVNGWLPADDGGLRVSIGDVGWT